MELKLQYRTRGNSSPQGKQKVYFCCHPMDFERYFEQISKAIWDTQNCAICFFPEDAEVTEDERSFELKGMQLFVMPVTTNLLTTENQALKDFSFAQEQRIPVLPLMQETQLEELYQKKIGNLQFLMKNDGDLTALPYEEKLKKYLASVLVGDELAEKVRKAFDAYIFLSYRKKDRKYAQDLMRLIHKNDFCRDIAIWYDEYLTPGEDFNQAIQDALSRCELFTLVVTPSLLETYVDEHGEEKKNYVMEHEYPMARDTKKPILPTQMQETDGNALSDCYDGIGTATDAHDEAALRELFLAAVKKLAIQENDKDPMHNYFIGLAYLNGIDVEVDRERAVALITSAAEANLPEAMEKLVYMNINGESVRQDYDQAIYWQEKLIDFYKVAVQLEPSAANVEIYIEQLWNLGDYCTMVGKEAAAIETFVAMQKESENVAGQFSECKTLYYRIVGNIKLGDIYREKGCIQEAVKYYQAAESLIKVAQEQDQISILYQKTYAYCLERFGHAARENGDLEKQNEYYIRNCMVLEYLLKENSNGQFICELGTAYNLVGDTKMMMGELEEAKAYYCKAIDILLPEETVDTHFSLFFSYFGLGKVAKRERNLVDAANNYLEGLRWMKHLAEKKKTSQYRRELSAIYRELGDVFEQMGRYGRALDNYSQSVQVINALYEEDKSYAVKQERLLSYEYFGLYLCADNQYSRAKEFILESLNTALELENENSSLWIRHSILHEYEHLCFLEIERANYFEAKEYARKALNIAKSLWEETGALCDYSDLSACYCDIGRIFKGEQNIDEASRYLYMALKIVEEIADKEKTVSHIDNFAAVCYHYGSLGADYIQYMKKAFDIWTDLAKQFPDCTQFADKRDLARRALTN